MLRDIVIVIIGVLIVEALKFILAVRVKYSILKRESRADHRSGQRGGGFRKRFEEATKLVYTEKLKHRKKH